MKTLLLILGVAAATLLSGCIVAPYDGYYYGVGGYHHHHHRDWD